MKIHLRSGLVTLAIAVIACSTCGQSAHAFSIGGSIEFGGSAKATMATKKGITTTTLTFANPWHVIADDGDYSSVPVGTSATFKTVKYTGSGTGATLTAPVIPQWTFTFNGGTYSFDLMTLTDAVVTSTAMNLSGTGTVQIGSDSAPASWALQGTGSKFTFKFSSSTTTAVPDGGSAAALLGIALIAVAALRKNLKVS
jgi:hypothetical protein